MTRRDGAKPGWLQPEAHLLVDTDDITITRRHIFPSRQRAEKATRNPLVVEVLALRGEFDIHTARHLQHVALDQHVTDQRPMVLDLMGVTFLDCAMVGVMVSLRHDLRRRQRELIIVTDHNRVRRVLNITGMHHILHLHRSLDEALTTVSETADPLD